MTYHQHFALVLSDYAIIAISLSFLLVIIMSLLFLCYKNRRQPSSPCSTADDTSVTALLRAGPFPMADLEAATDSFHHSRLIGKGHLGTVYKASTAPDIGNSVAIKRLHSRLVLSHPGPTFSRAIKSLSFVASHLNIIPVLGYAEAPGERIIIYEYVPEKTLESFLYGVGVDGGQLMRQLSWRTRVKIAAGIARGLEHLHASTALGIAHGCLKPCNVFIDKDYIARVSDYGLGFLLQGEEEKKSMAGYVDKEGYEVCKENDVYAFGVIILEMLSGRRCEGGRLVEWALPLIRVSRVEEVLDKRLAFPFMEIRVLVRMAKVASACVGNSRGYRLLMAEVVAIFNRLEMELCA
ncbi:putative receptor protein kinase CRINKLY4 [Carex littledalei]|uniref:Putative receptor protein kinase CRINKLY4 n=1 Tax=Carex littledalei TaxID=544730 RepID=A0A833VLU9_9POAL|nr:putative receptor protein kinase CRINKLY4 [Carex littledalei]